MNTQKNSSFQNSCASQSREHIKGIKCDVKNCVYHDCDTYCTANQIAVGKSRSEASCDTFKERR